MTNNVLLYISKIDISKPSILHSFADTFYKKKINLIILFERINDYEFFCKKKFLQNINLFSTKESYKKKNNEKIKNINSNLKSFYKNTYSLEKNFNANFYSLDFFLKKNKINSCIIDIGQGAINSFTVCVLNDYCISKKINVYFPMTNSPLNNRYMIYQDIYLTNMSFNSFYKNTINNKNIIDYTKLNKFKKLYIENEKNFLKRYNKFNTSSFSKYKINDLLSILKNYIYKKIIYRRGEFFSITHKPFVLFLINKSDNHWYTKYSDYHNLNRKALINKILIQIPNNYNLVVKCHPRIWYERDLEKHFYKNKRVVIVYEDIKNPSTVLINLLNECRFVIGSNTTGIIIALLFRKVVFDISKISAYFNFQNPPVISVKKIYELKEKISNNKNFTSFDNKIDSYFFSLMNISLPFYRQNSISHIVDKNTFCLIAENISKLILSVKK